jgi:hypothetical protein
VSAAVKLTADDLHALADEMHAVADSINRVADSMDGPVLYYPDESYTVRLFRLLQQP